MGAAFRWNGGVAVAENLKGRRERVKRELLELRGGKCSSCGYSRAQSALCFHHRSPEDKEFNISGSNLTRIARERLEAEVLKADVLCLNCHAELHDKEGWVHENGRRTPK